MVLMRLTITLMCVYVYIYMYCEIRERKNLAREQFIVEICIIKILKSTSIIYLRIMLRLVSLFDVKTSQIIYI